MAHGSTVQIRNRDKYFHARDEELLVLGGIDNIGLTTPRIKKKYLNKRNLRTIPGGRKCRKMTAHYRC